MSDPLREAVADLARRVELEDVVYHTVSGRRREPPSEDDHAEQTLQVSIGSDDSSFAIRCRVGLEAPDAVYEVDASIHYVTADALDADEAVLRGFAEHVGVMALYPYLRAAVHDLSIRLGVGRALMPIVRTGTIRLGDVESSPED